MSSTESLEIARRLTDAFVRSDYRAAIDLMAPDIVHSAPCVPPGVPKVMHGHAEVEPVLKMFFSQVVKTYSYEELELHPTDDPELVVGRGKSKIILRSGRAYSNEYAYFFRVRGGKIKEFTEFFDTTRAAEAFAGVV